MVNYSLPTNSQPPIRDDCNTVCFLYGLFDLHLNSVELCIQQMSRSSMLEGCMLGEKHSEISSNTHCLWASDWNQLHTQLEQDTHQHFSDYVPPLSKKNLISGGPWAVAIDKVSPQIEVKGLLSEVACCELYAHGQMILHLCCILHIWFGTVFANVHSFSFYISCSEMYPHVR